MIIPQAQANRNRPIRARDQDGGEHYLVVVDHPAGLISLADDEMLRILSLPDAALLARQLEHQVRRALGFVLHVN
jgi:hypothetical protein